VADLEVHHSQNDHIPSLAFSHPYHNSDLHNTQNSLVDFTYLQLESQVGWNKANTKHKLLHHNKTLREYKQISNKIKRTWDIHHLLSAYMVIC